MFLIELTAALYVEITIYQLLLNGNLVILLIFVILAVNSLSLDLSQFFLQLITNIST